MSAIKAVKIGKQSLQIVAVNSGIARSSLYRYVTKFDNEVEDIAALNDDEIKIVLRKIAGYAKHKMV